jgi:hypothetical protein
MCIIYILFLYQRNQAATVTAAASYYTATPANEKVKRPRHYTDATNCHLRHLFYKLFPRERDYR